MESVKQYFKPEQWQTMSEYEKKRHVNVYEIYTSMKELGMILPVPDFMISKSKHKEKSKTPDDSIFKVPCIPNEKKPGKKRSSQDKETNKKTIKNNCKEYEEIVNAFKSSGMKGFKKEEIDYSKLEFLTIDEFLKELLDTVKMSRNCSCIHNLPSLNKPNRYPKRNVKKVNYAEIEIRDDCYIYCDVCQREYEQAAVRNAACPEHGLMPRLFDKNASSDSRKITRAERTLREDWLAIRQSSIKNAGLGVWTKDWLPVGTLLGPYEGQKSKQGNDNGYCWTIVEKGKVSHYIDGENEGVSNWLRYVNCSRNISEQNLQAFQFFGQLYYRAVKDIAPHSELFVYYGNKYASKLGIDTKSYFKHADKPFPNGTFKCSGCVYNFASPLYLEEHQKRCRKYKSYLITSEQKEKSENKLHKCTKCDYVTPDPKVLSTHLSAAHPEGARNKNRAYNRGDSSFSRSNTLSSRNETVHDKDEKHVRAQSADRPFKCTTNDNLSNHVKDLSCEQCAYKTNDGGNLKVHMRTHTDERPYKCDQCEYSCKQNGSLKVHMRTHTDERPYKCDQCEYSCKQNGSLKVHMRTHTDERPYKCDQCEYSCKQNGSLKVHMRTHTGERPYKCEHCEYSCTKNGDLSKHVKAVHLGIKDLACEHCAYKTSYSSRLKEHIRVHTGETPYKCEHCEFSCKQNGDLSRHIKTAHQGIKDLACEHCAYKTSNGSSLKAHIRTHTGERPYKCIHCEHTFTQSGSLSTHVKTVHKTTGH